MTGRKVLVVDDEDNLRSMLVAALKYEGYDVAEASDGNGALGLVKTFSPNIVVLDVMMPGIDGFAVVKRLRDRGDRTPVIFLTARDTTADKIAGLNLGADDYLPKPFSLDELVARIESVSRRYSRSVSESVLSCGDLVLDDIAHRVTRDGEEIDLSPTEHNLLRYLMENTGRVLSRNQILENVWGYHDDTRVVETYIGYVRKKVDRSEPHLIHTIRGVGYTLRLP
jgi:two-component system, OmpR family, response regulator